MSKLLASKQIFHRRKIRQMLYQSAYMIMVLESLVVVTGGIWTRLYLSVKNGSSIALTNELNHPLKKFITRTFFAVVCLSLN